MSDSHEEKQLVFDTAMALRGSPFRDKRRQSLDALHMMARAIVAHLKLCRWEFRKWPVAPH